MNRALASPFSTCSRSRSDKKRSALAYLPGCFAGTGKRTRLLQENWCFVTFCFVQKFVDTKNRRCLVPVAQSKKKNRNIWFCFRHCMSSSLQETGPKNIQIICCEGEQLLHAFFRLFLGHLQGLSSTGLL